MAWLYATIAINLAWIYLVVDLTGTITHLWRGNFISLAARNSLDRIASGAYESIAPLAYDAFVTLWPTSVKVITYAGFDERTAEVIAAGIGFVAYMRATYLLNHYVKRWVRRLREEAESELRR